jgi:hypothetical protein
LSASKNFNHLSTLAEGVGAAFFWLSAVHVISLSSKLSKVNLNFQIYNPKEKRSLCKRIIYS